VIFGLTPWSSLARFYILPSLFSSKHRKYLWLVIGLFGVAQVLELTDGRICSGFILSGHTLKHLVGGLAKLLWWSYRYSIEGIHVENLPLQLCDAAVRLSVIARFTVTPVIVQFAWFAGLGERPWLC
jgi:uncharacterized membrane protein YwaF